MLIWIRNFTSSSFKTKSFIFNTILHGSLIIGTAIYCYARLDSVRSHKNIKPKAEMLQNK